MPDKPNTLGTFLDQSAIPCAPDPTPYLHEDAYNTTAEAIAVLLPENTQQVQQIVRFACEHRLALIPQGGNSNRTRAALPEPNGDALIVNLERMSRIARISTNHDAITLEAGCTLAKAQAAAEAVDRVTGIDLSARDWCQIGGNIATNAGGMQCLRYGNMREQVLGLEVVTPDGTVHAMMDGLHKNNAGYDLKQLFIGAEGTLGIITRAILRLHPKPRDVQTAALACATLKKAVILLRQAQQHWGTRLQRLEYLSPACQDIVKLSPGCPALPFNPYPEALLILEVSDLPDPEPLYLWLEALSADDTLSEAIPSQNSAMTASLWNIRERCGDLNQVHGQQVKHDIAVPPEQLPAFISAAEATLVQNFPGALPAPFGHWGDGNLHYDVSPTPQCSPGKLARHATAINRCIEDLAVAHGGTFSAEHGIGVSKKSALKRLKDPATLDLMRQIKATFDPHNIMNPGKVL
ncbi:MAG: FAD-binding oxidoreductase [Alphaproteobacteria bacterium]|nr:FAD-binding oxidoreductase [Alphaproteobacteria bacterium]